MSIIYIMGKSSSGKDTIFNILRDKLDVNTYVLYTTRPMREGEINGVTYNFITNEEMNKYINGEMPEKLIEKRTYQTVHGAWTYATIADKQFRTEKSLLMLGTLESYNDIKKILNKQIIPIYIEVEDGIRLQRALEREQEQKQPKYAEMCRRYLADSFDFSEENIRKAGIVKRFKNLELDTCVEEILQYIEKEEKRRNIEEERE